MMNDIISGALANLLSAAYIAFMALVYRMVMKRERLKNEDDMTVEDNLVEHEKKWHAAMETAKLTLIYPGAFGIALYFFYQWYMHNL